MKQEIKRTFEDQRILLDGACWLECTFVNCEIVINTGEMEVKGCHFNKCRLILDGNAKNIFSMIELFSNVNKKNIALLVGNGFTLDFVEQHGLNSSYPLKNFNNMDINYSEFINYLPSIKKELMGQDIPDFDSISDFLTKYKISSVKECELRRFLAMAYSKFQLSVDQHDMHEWKWVKWLKQNREQIACGISFNYDLLLERAITHAGISYSRVGTNEQLGNIPILKPHGSIDFDVTNGIVIEPIETIWNVTTTLNNLDMVEVIKGSEWLKPRVEADIIPPSVANYNRQLRWIDSMYNLYESISGSLRSLIMIGCSYWDVDRPEIDFFLEKLPKSAKIYIMNPKPSEPLIEKIESLGLSWDKFNFDELPW